MREVDPMGIFLIETKVCDVLLHSILRRIGFLFFIFVLAVGLRGGLAFLLEARVEVQCSELVGFHLSLFDETRWWER